MVFISFYIMQIVNGPILCLKDRRKIIFLNLLVRNLHFLRDSKNTFYNIFYYGTLQIYTKISVDASKSQGFNFEKNK